MPEESHPTPPPPELKGRVTRSLRDAGVLRARRRWAQIPVVIAAGLALFVAGTFLPRTASVTESTDPAFVLLLYEDAGFQPTISPSDIVREYTAWTDTLRQRGRVVVAEELDQDFHVVGAAAPEASEPLGVLTGMFVVHAANEAAALELARGHPHLRHGGRIVVRGFVRHG